MVESNWPLMIHLWIQMMAMWVTTQDGDDEIMTTLVIFMITNIFITIAYPSEMASSWHLNCQKLCEQRWNPPQ